MFLVSACNCVCTIYQSQVLSREWRCSWSSADRRCSNYISVINTLIVYFSVPYIRDLTVCLMYCRICEMGQLSLTEISPNLAWPQHHWCKIAVLCVKFQRDSSTKKKALQKQVFASFQFNVDYNLCCYGPKNCNEFLDDKHRKLSSDSSILMK